MYFEIQGSIEDIEPIAIGNSIRELARLKKQFGSGRWRKLKGTANFKLPTDISEALKSIGMKPTESGNEK